MNLEIFSSPFTLVFGLLFFLAAACLRCYGLHLALMQEQESHMDTAKTWKQNYARSAKRNAELSDALAEADADRCDWAEKADETNEELKRYVKHNEELTRQNREFLLRAHEHTLRADACDDLRTECKRYAEQLDAANQAKERWQALAESLHGQTAKKPFGTYPKSGPPAVKRTNIGPTSATDVDALRNENLSLRQRVAMLVEDAKNGHASQTQLKYENAVLNNRIASVQEISSRYAEKLEELTEKIEALRNG